MPQQNGAIVVASNDNKAYSSFEYIESYRDVQRW